MHFECEGGSEAFGALCQKRLIRKNMVKSAIRQIMARDKENAESRVSLMASGLLQDLSGLSDRVHRQLRQG